MSQCDVTDVNVKAHIQEMSDSYLPRDVTIDLLTSAPRRCQLITMSLNNGGGYEP